MRFYFYIITASSLFSLQAAALPQLDSSKWAMQVFWLVIIFGGLYLALQKLALPQVSETISARENRITERLEDARRLFAEAKESETAQNNNLIAARHQAQDIRLEMQKKISEQNRIELTKLDEKIEAQLSEAEQNIEQQLGEAKQNIHLVAANAASDIFQQITGKEISEDKAKQAISQITEDV